MALEEAFDLRISSKQMVPVRTVGDVQDLVLDCLRSSARAADETQVRARVCQVITEVGSFKDKLDPGSLSREMRLIEDLGWG
jgi:hypothetical protein